MIGPLGGHLVATQDQPTINCLRSSDYNCPHPSELFRAARVSGNEALLISSYPLSRKRYLTVGFFLVRIHVLNDLTKK